VPLVRLVALVLEDYMNLYLVVQALLVVLLALVVTMVALVMMIVVVNIVVHMFE
jgi:hypothetical protein